MIPVWSSISGLRRRGYTPEAIKMFVDLCGVSKSQSSVDYGDAGVLHPRGSEDEEAPHDGGPGSD